MAMKRYAWEPRRQFADRGEDLARLESWWASGTRDAMVLLGRRRVGKSWLFRRFAHGKPAVLLVADERLPTTQMGRFAAQLEPELGFRPALHDLRTLVELLYRLGRERKILAVIDEFPYLLPEGAARRRILTEMQAAMEEEREQSQTKLLLCGSLIGQMDSLLSSQSPLHGRLQSLDIWPMTFAEARTLSERTDSSEQRVARYAITGGMARYLAELGKGRDLRGLVCERVLDRRGPLFDDPRGVLEQELRSPATYFSILEELADHPAQLEHLTRALSLDSKRLSPYLETLQRMRLVSASLPVGAPQQARSRRYSIGDGFIRFWFRFVFPNQEGLQSGLRPEDVWDADVEPFLADFVAPAFEALCVRYTRLTHGATASRVGSWWGRALNRQRRLGARFSEEIDVAAAQRKTLRVVGECKWTTEPMPKAVLVQLREFKIPAVAEENRLKVARDGPQVLLFSRSGFRRDLKAAVQDDPRVTLVELDELVAGVGS
jgi:AAA+ ATPase superfamily predicted ATPase